MSLLKISLPTAALVAAALAWAQSSVRPGQYEVTAEIRMPGEPTATKYTALDCITAEEAADLQSALMEQLVSDDSCEVSNVESSAGKMTFDTNCDGIVTHAVVTFTQESMTFVLTTTVDGQTSTSTSHAKWVGATCAADEE